MARAAPPWAAPSPEEVWRRYDAIESRLTAPLSERMLDLAGVRPGMRLLDLASGRGEPALPAARRVGPTGSVLGVEVAAAMAAMAGAKAVRAGLHNLELRVGDAESLDDLPAASFDAATVRWGLMYMGDPVAALRGARRALKAGAPLVAAVWAEPERVAYDTLPRRLLARYREPPRVDPDAPGTFRYCDVQRVARDFGLAGLQVEHVEEMDVSVIEAETCAEVVAWTLVFGLGPLLADLPAAQQQAWEHDLAAELEGGRTGGHVRLGGTTRLVVARAAGTAPGRR